MKSIFAIALFLIAHLYISAQDIAINNIVATDIVATDKDIVTIKFNDQLPNLPFVMAWIDADGKQYGLQLVTGPEDIEIKMSDQPGWSGTIGLLGLSMNNVDVTIRKPELADYWKTFLNKIPLSPGSINFTGEYQLYNQPFRWIALGILAVLSIILFIKIREPRLSYLIAFLIAWGVYDSRSITNRWDIMSELKKTNYEINIYRDLDNFIAKARPIIGDKSWTKELLSGVLNSYCTYHLADLPYKPYKSSITDEADFIITHTPKKREVVLREGGIFLIKNNR